MHLNHLHLQHFRNYRDDQLFPGKGLNIVLGDNAQGKSNLLEAIAYLSFGRSPRGVNDIHVLAWEAPFFIIEAEIQENSGNLSFHLIYEREKGKKLLVNGVPQSRLHDGVGIMQAVWFAPEHLALVKGPPLGRRNFLDLHISQLNPRFRSLVQQYRQLLMQRNHLLRQARSSVAVSYQLDVWDEQLVEVGSRLLSSRLETVQVMKVVAAEAHRKYSGGEEQLEVSYVSTIGADEKEKDVKFIKSLFASRLAESRRQDINQGVTLVGPHRDDLHLKINGRESRLYSSQGQQRTIALSLKVAEMELIRRKTGEYPLLLLDDVLSELDLHRREQLLKDITDTVQCFVSASTREGIPLAALKQAEIINVRQGKLS
ncbi:hypothetical protein SY88_07635 [Clostridiales bacterium PH28_bin88]|nr:hypothetical protein SY88_07635 [Clostridiales bacterium PH28_bin88]